jgi:5'(3')-deoxyribonucleotidase
MSKALDDLRSPGERAEEAESFGNYSGQDYLRARRNLVKTQPGFWRNLEPLESGFRIVEILRQLDFELHILTKGPQNSTNAWTEKVEWCKQYIPDASIVIAQDKGLVYGKVLVDDWPSYVNRWLEWRPRGLIIMPAHKWNVGFEHSNVIRYENSNQEEAIKKALVEIRRTAA